MTVITSNHVRFLSRSLRGMCENMFVLLAFHESTRFPRSVTLDRMKAVSYDLPCVNLTFSMAEQPLVTHGLLFMKASRSHSETPHSVGFLLTSDQSPYNTQHSPESDIHPTDSVRTRNPSKRAATNPHLSSRASSIA